MRVLVVDDNDLTAECLADLLRQEGYDAETVGDGRSALERLARTPAVQVVLLDLMLPVLDGWEFLRELRSWPDWSRFRVVVFTALSDPRLDGLVGLAGVVPKPFDFRGDLLPLLRGLGRG